MRTLSRKRDFGFPSSFLASPTDTICITIPIPTSLRAMKALPRIPGYELLTCLGRGVTTTVYSARACDTDFPCAVQVLRPDCEGQPAALKLLTRDALAGLSVLNPHIVRLFHDH